HRPLEASERSRLDAPDRLPDRGNFAAFRGPIGAGTRAGEGRPLPGGLLRGAPPPDRSGSTLTAVPPRRASAETTHWNWIRNDGRYGYPLPPRGPEDHPRPTHDGFMKTLRTAR